MRVIHRRPQHAEFAPCGSGRSLPDCHIRAAGFAVNLRHCLTLPERDHLFDGRGDAPWRCRRRSVFLRIVRQHVGYEDLNGITRAGVARADVEEGAEGGFSEFAICSAR